MTLLTQFFQHPLMQALAHAMGWTLLHFLWQGAVVAALLWCVLELLDGRSPRVRYGVSLGTFALMALMVAITFGEMASAQYRLLMLNRSAGFESGSALVLRVGAGSGVAPWPVRFVIALDHLVPWVLMLWLAGAIVSLARLHAGFFIAQRMRSTATPTAQCDLQEVLQELCHRIGVSRPVRLMHSAMVQAPTVIGWLRPVVLIPVSCFTGLSAVQIEAILGHELAHIRRHDYLVSIFQSVMEALLFYHPAVWWVSKQMRRERECCCDDLAVEVSGDAFAYASALSQLEEKRVVLPQLVLGINGGVLTMRIKRLLGYRESVGMSQLAAAMVLAVLLAGAGVMVGTMARAESNNASRAQAIAPPIELEMPAELDTQIAVPTMRGMKLEAARMREVRLDGPVELAQADAPPSPAVRPTGPVRVSGGMMAGNLLSRPNPVYPPDAKAAHVQGAVVLHAVISKTGTIEDISVVSGPEMLRDASLEAVRQWTYRPYLLNGQPTEVDTTITVNFTFGGAPAAPQGQAESPAATRPDGTIRVSSGTIMGNLLTRVDPVYPPEAKADHVMGAVILRAVISKLGMIDDASVVSGPERLREAALDAVRQWTFRPYLLNGQPVEVETSFTIRFELGASQTAPAEGTEQGADAGVAPRRIGGAVSAPDVIYQVPPEFSEQARSAKTGGAVLVNLWVDEQGNPTHVRVVRGVGMGLDEKAVEAVKQYRFRPAYENGKPVVVALNIEVNFRIQDPPKAQAQLPNPKPLGPALQATGSTLPVLIHSVDPEYTEQARKDKASGIVTVHFTVDESGNPTHVMVTRGIGHGLDQKAIEAVRKYKFKPALRDGQPVAYELNIEVNFQIF